MPSLVLAILLFVTNLQAAPPQPPAAHAQAVIAALQAKAFERVESEFTDRMHAALPPGRLAATWAQLETQAGTLKSCATPAVTTQGELQIARALCDFERGKLDVQIVFDGAGKLAGLNFRPPAPPPVPYTPPSYATPASYTASDVTVGAGEWALPATLTLPNGSGPFPAVVLVHGSGPNDRDETLGPNKPFADLAAGLASRGIAVLRYDKRTKVYGAKMAALPSMTVNEETIDDAVLAAALLRTTPKIDPPKVFVLGHSLGAMLVPRIVAADSKFAGAIVMAGPARPLERAMLEQTQYLANADGTVTPDEQARIDEMTKLVADVAALKPEDAAAGKKIMNAPASYWLDLRGYDAPDAARALKTPLLVLQGERDYQVTMDEFARWKTALAGRSDVTFHSYPALNHLFLAGTGKSLPAEYDRPSHVDQQVVDDIAAWIKR
jgi:dienelactone hydrolase